MSTGTSRHSQPVKVKQNAKHFQPVEGSGMTDENFKHGINKHMKPFINWSQRRLQTLINPCCHLLEEMTAYQNLKQTCFCPWSAKCGPERGPAEHER